MRRNGLAEGAAAGVCQGGTPAAVEERARGRQVPFNRTTVVGTELEYVRQAIERGHLTGDGEFTRRCQAWLERTLAVPKALLTTSCTDALEMAALLLDVGPGDEVIVPSFTFVSTANAFALRGATPVFADIRPDTLNMDETKVEGLLTSRTKAIVPVHYAGVGCEMDALCEIARRRNVVMVEDNAHGLGARYRGRALGTFGTFATQSFHGTKNVTCGEGGALLVNDPSHVQRAEIIREKGTNRSRFLRGEVDKYTWVDLGSSHVPSDILAAFLLAQLEAADSIQERRRTIWERYYDSLGPWARERGVRLPFVPPHCDQPYHLFYLVLPEAAAQRALTGHLKERGIASTFHYQPLNLSPMGQRFGARPGDCPVTERIADRLLRLPFYTGMSEEEQRHVVAAVKAFPPAG